MPAANWFEHQVLQFINNPHAKGEYPDPTGMGKSWDILTAPDPTGYSVPVNTVSVGDGDVAVIYRTDAGADHRDPGKIVAIARITSSPWFSRWGYAQVSWELQLLPPECWIGSTDMKNSGLWDHKVPFTQGNPAPSPVHLTEEQWAWLQERFPTSAVEWLKQHADDTSN